MADRPITDKFVPELNLLSSFVIDTEDYLVFVGHESGDDTEEYELEIQQVVIVDRILYIAARNNIYTVDMDTSHTREIYFNKKLTWKSSREKLEKCILMGKFGYECHNFIKVLIKRNEDTLFICGTDSFSPTCRNYKIDTLEVEEEISGKGRCPYDAKDNNVALFAGGYLYSGTVSDAMSRDSLIYRSLGDTPPLRTAQYDSKWLKDPNFIHVVDYGNYIYYFFREVAVEYFNVGEIIVSRVARICKNDMGGNMAFLDQKWTSFLKARLNCLVPSLVNFYFNILQAVTNVVHINGHDVVFAVFTTPENSIPGSAVCAYDMLELDKVFSGRFKEQLSPASIWTPVPSYRIPTPRPGSCAGSEPLEEYTSSNDFPEDILKFMKNYHLMNEGISSIESRPWFLRTTAKYRITHIAVDVSAGANEDRVVVFLGSQKGMILKVVDISGENAFLSKSLFVEEMVVYNSKKCQYKGWNDPKIMSMKLDKPSDALYVAFRTCVIKVPLARCHFNGKCKKACIANRDPYCGWVKESEECKYLIPGDGQEFEQDVDHGNLQDMDDCSKK
ncbi:semaphorin-6A-like [Eublepharis macularius]|uniref:Semaphorin-6A-like n=1 Tax=Eublepharis macularius TaxID=481883 RepID=A0AA97K2P9_EUBMA|nr:semaphorin-6A-like [Eublepharis macularius]